MNNFYDQRKFIMLQNLETLKAALWKSADAMRATMNADQYQDYLLCLVFYKYISDRQLYTVVELLEEKVETLDEAQIIYEKAENSEEYTDLQEELRAAYGYDIKPEYTFTNFINRIKDKTFLLGNLNQAFRDIEQSNSHAYSDLFETFDIDSKALGDTPQKRNEIVSAVMMCLADVNFIDYGADALGDAYEYLISQFAASSGKKAGEFYTPQKVSELITRIVVQGKEDQKGFSIYDPCMGSGSLLLQIRKYIKKENFKFVNFFGQEIKNTTYNLARMNMMLHNVPVANQYLHSGDTLDKDWPTSEPTTFDATVMNPPYSQTWSAIDGFLTDPRFSPYERLAPKKTADFAFLLHGFYHLKDDGCMGIVLPHGVLFRGAAEGTIRKHLLEEGSIYAVIGLPANIFTSTGIPTCVLILKKNNKSRDVLFIDASKDFVKVKTTNVLTEEHINKIMDAYNNRQDVEKYAHLATFEEIQENDFNLNIPRYVDTFEEEAPIDIEATFKELQSYIAQEKELNNSLNDSFKELGLNITLGE